MGGWGQELNKVLGGGGCGGFQGQDPEGRACTTGWMSCSRPGGGHGPYTSTVKTLFFPHPGVWFLLGDLALASKEVQREHPCGRWGDSSGERRRARGGGGVGYWG